MVVDSGLHLPSLKQGHSVEHTAGPRSPLTTVAFAYAGTAAVALLVFPHLRAPLDRFGAPYHGAVVLGWDPGRGLLWGLGVGGMLAGAGQAVTRLTVWGRRLQAVIGRLVGGIHPADAVLLAALSAAAEELVFRGMLLPYLGLWVSSLLFGLAHLVPREGLWPWSAWTAGAGVVLGWTALGTGGLLAPITAHFVVNAVGLLLLSRQSG